MIRLEHVHVTFDQTIHALVDVNLDIKAKTTGLIGANGSGKTTLLRSLVGLEQASGTIRINDMTLTKETLTAIRGQVGYLFQNPDHQLFMKDVRSDLAFGLKSRKMSAEAIARQVDEIAAELKITHLLDRSPIKLSGGQKSLCALAGVLVMKPDLLLLDEPTAFLDPRSRRRIIQILKELPQDIVLATHDLDLVYELCEDIILIDDGRIAAQGAAQVILNDGPLLEAHGLEALRGGYYG